jgi:hypothetical protein
MSILSKVTLGFVIIAALAFWYMAMRTLKTHQAWRNAHAAAEKALAAKQADIQKMLEGDPEQSQMSLGKLQVALDSAMFGRGRVWSDGIPRYDQASNTVSVQIGQPQPHQIEVNKVLHAFQGLDDPSTGQYIGEFKVTAVDGNGVTLAPSYRPTAQRQQLITNARGPWSLYELMPADMNELFAGLTDDQIDELLPPPPQQQQGESNDDFQARQEAHARMVRQYKQDNKPIDPNDPPPDDRISVIVKFVKDQKDLTEAAKADLRAIDFGENLVKSGNVMKVDLPTAKELVRLELVQEVERRFQRKLHDYSFVMHEFHRRLPIVEDQIVNLEKDIEFMKTANDEATKHLADAETQKAALQQELALVSKEREVVVQFHGTLSERLNKVNTEIARLREENQRLATQLAQRQLQAVESPARSAAATALASPR